MSEHCIDCNVKVWILTWYYGCYKHFNVTWMLVSHSSRRHILWQKWAKLNKGVNRCMLRPVNTRAPFQYTIGRLIVRYHEVSKQRKWEFEWYRFEICGAYRQHYTCQISGRSYNSRYKSCGFKMLPEHTIRCRIGYWNGAPHSKRPCSRPFNIISGSKDDFDDTNYIFVLNTSILCFKMFSSLSCFIYGEFFGFSLFCSTR